MKYTTLLTALGVATMNASAGTSKSVVEPAPAPEPSLRAWFIGGTYGQLSDVETSLADEFEDIGDSISVGIEDVDLDMYTLHFGRSFANTNGWDFAAYLEVAYITGDAEIYADYDFGEDSQRLSENFDIDIIPVTLNFKVERQLFGPISAYVTGGAGYAWTKFEIDGDSTDDGGFYAQASAGLIWNVNESFEVYGGARWLHLEDLDISEDFGIELEDSFAWEVGLRYNF